MAQGSLGVAHRIDGAISSSPRSGDRSQVGGVDVDEAIDAPTLERRLAEAAQAQPPTEVHVRGDRAVAYEHVVRVMTAAQQAGVTRLGFVTEVSD